VPYVSHYRLAAHFLLAVILIGCCVWFAIDLKPRPAQGTIQNSGLRKVAIAICGLFFLQLIWGAFTAGLNAGMIYNTFPLMNGNWMPFNTWTMQPVIINFFENPGTVQWTHRIIGTRSEEHTSELQSRFDLVCRLLL